MICKNCGKELPQGSKFCTGCGAPVEAAGAQPVRVPAAAAPAETAPVSVPVTPPVAVEPSAPAAGEPVLTGKNSKTLVIMGAAAVVVLILLIVLVKALLGGGGGGKGVYVYANEDDELMLLKSLKENADTVELNDDPTVSVRFSKDGKYLYFFTNKDGSGYSYTGDLYRVEVSKIGKKDAEPEKISSDVSVYNTVVLDNGNVVFVRDNQLRYFDGKENQRLANDVSSFIVNEKQTYAYYTEMDSSDYSETLYRVELKADGEKEKLVSGADSIWSSWDADMIIYGTDNEDGTYDVYSVTPGGEKSKLVKNVTAVLDVEDAGSKAVFSYITKETESYSLYDLVSDSTLDADNETLASSWPNSMDYWETDDDGTEFFNAAAYNDAYNTFRDARDVANNRSMIRSYLQNNSRDVVTYDLYRYENDESTELATGLNDYPVCEGSIYLYSRKDQNVSKLVALEDLDYGSQIFDYINESEVVWYQKVDGTESTLKIDEDLTPNGLYVLNGSEAVVYAWDDEYRDYLLAYSVGKDGLTFSSTVTDEEFRGLTVGTTKGGKDALYYFEEISSSNNTGDLICYSGGQKTTAAKEATQVIILDDNSAIFKIDDVSYNNRTEQQEYSLYVVNDGKDTRIADDVSSYTVLDAKQVVYITDGDLYVWNGSASTRIAREVTAFWTNDTAELTYFYIW